MPKQKGEKKIRPKKELLYATKLFRALVYFASALSIVLIMLILSRWNFRHEIPPFFSVDSQTFSAMMQKDVHGVIVDIRHPSMHAEAHIPAAVHGAWNDCTEFGVDICSRSYCKEKTPYYFYSTKGEDYHEVRYALRRTAWRGCYDEVYFLEGGFTDWVKESRPIEQ